MAIRELGNPLGNQLAVVKPSCKAISSVSRLFPVSISTVNDVTNSTYVYQQILGVCKTVDGFAVARIQSSSTYYAVGFSYDKTGIKNILTPAVSIVNANESSWHENFSGKMVFNSNVSAGTLYYQSISGTSITGGVFGTIPSSGTLLSGETYTSLLLAYAIDDGKTMPRCFDLNGNLVVLVGVVIGGVNNLAAFTFDASGSIINSRKIFTQADSTNTIGSSSRISIKPTSSGFVIGYISAGTTTYFNAWYCNSTFTSITNLVSQSVSLTNSPLSYTIHVSNDTYIIRCENATDNIKTLYGGQIINGVAQQAGSISTAQSYKNNMFFPGGANYDNFNGIYYTNNQYENVAITTGTQTSYISGIVANTMTCRVGGLYSAQPIQQCIGAFEDAYNPNGISGRNMCYLGNGLWLYLTTFTTVGTLNARLYTEV